MKALVTGASGFIGSTLIAALNRRGIEPIALLRKTSRIDNLGNVPYSRVEGSLGDYESLCNAVKGVDYVFHLAGVVTAPDEKSFYECNATGTGLLAKAVATHNPGLKKFVYVSSLAAGGPKTSLHPRSEIEEDTPVSAYGRSKLEGEKELLQYKDQFPISIIRPPLVYGPKDKGVFVLIQTVSRGLMPILRGSTDSGEKFYSVVHADDLCEGILCAAEKGEGKGEIFYICEDKVYTYAEIMGTVAEVLERKTFKIPVPAAALRGITTAATWMTRITGKRTPLTQDKLNELLPDYWICDNSKAKKMLQFTPRHNLKSGMTHAIKWYQENGWL